MQNPRRLGVGSKSSGWVKLVGLGGEIGPPQAPLFCFTFFVWSPGGGRGEVLPGWASWTAWAERGRAEPSWHPETTPEIRQIDIWKASEWEKPGNSSQEHGRNKTPLSLLSVGRQRDRHTHTRERAHLAFPRSPRHAPSWAPARIRSC